MTAILKVDTIQDTAGNNIINENANTVTIGKAGDTVNVVGTLQNNSSALISGITMADQWRRTAAMTITSTAQILSANWEQVDTSGQGTIGSSMTQSSGVFTFPSTGLYFILVNQGFYDNSSDSRYFEFKIEATTNNSSYTLISRMTSSFKYISSYTYNMLTCNTYFNVTDTSLCKVRFKAESENNTTIGGDTAFNESQSYTFIRLGDSV